MHSLIVLGFQYISDICQTSFYYWGCNIVWKRQQFLPSLYIYIYIYIISVITIYTYHIVHSSFVLIYLVTESVYILTAFIQFPQPSWPNSDNHKSNHLLCVFVFEVQLYYTMLFPVIQHSNLVALYILNDHHDKSSYTSPYKGTTWLLIILLTMFFIPMFHWFCNWK